MQGPSVQIGSRWMRGAGWTPGPGAQHVRVLGCVPGRGFWDANYADLSTPLGQGRLALPATQMAAVLVLQAPHDFTTGDRSPILPGAARAPGLTCGFWWQVQDSNLGRLSSAILQTPDGNVLTCGNAGVQWRFGTHLT